MFDVGTPKRDRRRRKVEHVLKWSFSFGSVSLLEKLICFSLGLGYFISFPVVCPTLFWSWLDSPIIVVRFRYVKLSLCIF